ncbi:hypothetical protein STIP28_4 [Synechococcus T7-like virus S-TIP28]|uniref:Uncharacterized protein n=1 Tax=Synechococcus T7-like virus S-TIP28 TaxID=1332140 RepID=A0AAE9BPE6_9CAUD|nr:hypothetical protein STIP28_4 [Synechococcus T7-like virus S-TIP28]
MTEKEKLYKTNVQRSLVEMYAHMEKMLDYIPVGIEEKDLTDDHKEIISKIEAIEEEWIVDPDQREDLSLIKWEDDS